MQEAIEQLLELQSHAFDYVRKDSISEEEYFYATQNARLVKDAENYYRSMFKGRVSSWNVRDIHMIETLNSIADHLETRHKKPAKIIVWAHNSHVGDARATEMNERSEVNIGQLVREHHGTDTYLIGFSTYQGFVTAASDWGAPAEHMSVNPGMNGSYEELFHRLKHKNFLLNLNDNAQLRHYLQISRLQRAIGVIYSPETERFSHYFFTHLPYQFDCIIHFDDTTAVQPLDMNPEWQTV
jgi:erythromycin esterase-like protein